MSAVRGFAWATLGMTVAFGGAATAADDGKLGMVGSGYVIPGVTYPRPEITAAVGVSNVCSQAVDVYWVVTTEDELEKGRGVFTVQPRRTYAFILSQELASTFDFGKFGTLMIAGDVNGDGALTMSDPPCLVVEAFQANLVLNDAVFLPAWPFGVDDLAGTPRGLPDLELATPGDLSTLHSGIVDPPGDGSPTLFLRYSIGGGDTTYFVVWSAEDISGLILDGVGTNYTGTVTQIPVEMNNAHLNVIPANTLGLPAGFSNGMVYWPLPDDGSSDYFEAGGDGNGVAAYALIHSPGIGATQTILGLGR